MLPAHRVTTHPGEILLGEFLEPLRLSQAGLARALHIPQNRINELVRGKRGITPETAILLAEYFGTSAEFWMNLQSAHDLTKAGDFSVVSVPILPETIKSQLSSQKLFMPSLAGLFA